MTTDTLMALISKKVPKNETDLQALRDKFDKNNFYDYVLHLVWRILTCQMRIEKFQINHTKSPCQTPKALKCF